MLEIVRYSLGPLDNNSYLIADTTSKVASIVDPTFDSRSIWDDAVDRGWTIESVINTHAHIDHIVENAWYVEQCGGPLYLNSKDRHLIDELPRWSAWMGVPCPVQIYPDRELFSGCDLYVGENKITVLETPGHSPGSVTLLVHNFAIVGDVLYNGGIGRTDLPGGNHPQLLTSIADQLMCLNDDTIVYPGHGEPTTIGHERRTNPFLR